MASPRNSAEIVILASEGDPLTAKLVRALRSGRRSVSQVDTDGLAARIEEGKVDLFLLDLGELHGDLPTIFERIFVTSPQTEIVVITGADEIAQAVEAVEHGASDYVTKPLDVDIVCAAVQRRLDVRRSHMAGHIAMIVHQIASVRDVAQLPSRVEQAAIQATRAHDAVAYLWERGALVSLGDREHLPAQKGVAYEVLNTGAPVQVLDEDEGPVLGWPMVAHQEGVGVLVVTRQSGEPHFDSGDERLLSVVASEAALTLDRVRLVSDLRHQIEELQQARIQLAAAEQLQGVGSFATSWAHELQGPVQYVQSQLRTASDALRSENLDEVREALRYAIEGASRVQSSVGELSLLGRGRHDSLVDAARVVGLARRMARVDEVQPIVQTVADVTVQGNVGHLVQALTRLIRNASRALTNAEAPLLEITVTRDAEEVCFTVTDNGHGIPDDVLPHVFEPFVTTWEGHSGLGLGIAREIIEGARGRIAIEHRKGGGTHARIWLPSIQDEDTLELGDD